MAKNKKKGLSDKVRKSKSNANSAFGLDKVKNNPFEIKVNKQKHNIIGRKVKHDLGLPGVSRSKANKKRKETLLQEYKYRNKANNIKDERFGASDAQISLEEKMLQRFSLERKKKHEKMSQFNLNDDEELTHLGQSLSKINRFDDFMDSDGDEAGGTMSGEYVEHAHFGGGIFKKKVDDPVEDGNKSRKDVIEEIIAKSKKAKFEKQATKEKSEELRDKLDDAWEDFQKLIKPAVRTSYDKEEAREKSKPDDYDIFVKQMLFERKAAPTERSKTDEELTAEREAKMRKLEEERRLRMLMDQEEGERKPKHQSADALDDDFSFDKEEVEVEPLSFLPQDEEDTDDEDKADEDESKTHSDEDVDDLVLLEEGSDLGDQGIGEDGISVDADEPEDGSDSYSDIDSGNEDDVDVESLEEEFVEKIEVTVENPVKTTTPSKSKFPSSYSEFVSLLSPGVCPSKVVAKLRKEFSPGLGKGNKAKMIELFTYIWEHCCIAAQKHVPELNTISILTSHLYELCEMNTESCAQCVSERLKSLHYKLFKAEKSTQWPSLETMIQFKLIKLLFSTSDFRHNVVTPTLGFMCNILNNCRVLSLKDVARGLFVCTLVYEYVCFSKRLVPECLNFLATVISMAIRTGETTQPEIPEVAMIRRNRKNCSLLVCKDPTQSDVTDKPNLTKLLSQDYTDEEATDEERCQLIRTAFRLSDKFANLYSEVPAYDEIFSSLSRVCLLFIKSNDSCLQQHASSLLETINLSCGRPREPLTFGKAKPKTLRLYDPKVEDTVGEPFQKRSRKLNASKRERERLLHKRRREMKGAMREIRKDSKFISRQQQKEQTEMDEERAAKVKRLYGLLSNQEGEVKEIQRKKYKLDL